MSWIGFVLGLVCGILVFRLWTAARSAWRGVFERNVVQIELPGPGTAAPKALIRTSIDEYYVRQLMPARDGCWFREDTGEPVGEQLARRLQVLLAMAFADRERSQRGVF